MATRIKDVVAAFELLFEMLHKREFAKTLPFKEFNEYELSPLVRTYLLGYFRMVAPEVQVPHPKNPSGRGRIDFEIDDVAVEFAVRRPHDPRRNLSELGCYDERLKLLKYNGKSLLVLYDFSKVPFTRDDLERYRAHCLGQGNHKASAFNVAYFFRAKQRPITTGCENLNIRV